MFKELYLWLWYWDILEYWRKYILWIISRKKHVCPNLVTYNKESKIIIPPTTAAKPSYYNKEFSNANEATTKTKVKLKMDNSFEFLEWSPTTIRKQYEFISDIIRDCNGKVHGSQSHLSNNSMYLIIYYEVPEGKRDEIKKKIDNFAQYKNEMTCSRIR